MSATALTAGRMKYEDKKKQQYDGRSAAESCDGHSSLRPAVRAPVTKAPVLPSDPQHHQAPLCYAPRPAAYTKQFQQASKDLSDRA